MTEKSCENCRWGHIAYCDDSNGWRWLCTNPDNGCAKEMFNPEACGRYEPERLCGTCRWCAPDSENGWFTGYACKNPVCRDEGGDIPVDPDFDEACSEYEAEVKA